MLTEKSNLSTICCFFLENIVLEFWPTEIQKVVFLSKIEVLTPWFLEIAKMVIAKFVFQAFYDYC